FEGADEHLVAGLQAASAVALCHQIEAFGGAARPDDFLAAGVDEVRHRLACAFKGGGGGVGQGVGAAMHVAVEGAVVVVQRLDYHGGFLRGGGIVQIHQRLAVYLLRQQRKVGAQKVDIEAGGHIHLVASVTACPSQWLTQSATS